MRTMWRKSNLQASFSRFDTLLAWLAILLWETNWTQGYSGLHGFMDLLSRLFKWDWVGYRPIIVSSWIMIADSIFYWLGIILVILTAVLLIKKLFGQKDDDLFEKFKKEIITECEAVIENIQKLDKTVDEKNESLIKAIRDGACKYVIPKDESNSD